jgi:hypothetical protein
MMCENAPASGTDSIGVGCNAAGNLVNKSRHARRALWLLETARAATAVSFRQAQIVSPFQRQGRRCIRMIISGFGLREFHQRISTSPASLQERTASGKIHRHAYPSERKKLKNPFDCLKVFGEFA